MLGRDDTLAVRIPEVGISEPLETLMVESEGDQVSTGLVLG